MKSGPLRKRIKARPGRLKGEDMRKLRDACFERDRGICQNCGCMVDPYAPMHFSTAMHLAHKRNKRMWGDSLDQVACWCQRCHSRYHAWGPTMQKPVPAKESRETAQENTADPS